MAQGCRQRAEHLRLHALVGAYVDGELTGMRRARVAAHLAVCFACSGYAEALRLIKQSLRSSPHRTPPCPAGDTRP
ncbi:zf-HC2 domain-containing protein [Actinocrinis puniceicyclus]|uniref:Zf-HC2 domain-containing protein n=2 Tax=Actinocrinis puniceicyclus TaxID=977794 RepID=A0A8J7WQA1_9ACTN|nr:zf-HC2 domain-containing protein [Actinocrinis puniceicyclus]